MNEVDEFLAGLNNDGKVDPLIKEESDPFAAMAPKEGVKEEKAGEEDKPLPFHKDPKIQRFIAKEIAKGISTIKPTETEKFVKDTNTEDNLTAVLTTIIGNDTPEKQAAIVAFRKELSGLEEKGAQKALAQIQAQQQEEAKADQEAYEELQSGLESIEEQFDVDITSDNAAASKMRGEFIDFVKRIAPKDENGDVTQFPDLASTFELFKEQKKPETSSRAKDLASRGMSRSSEASNASKAGKSWKDIDRMFDKLN